jgi:hypothetical protein
MVWFWACFSMPHACLLCTACPVAPAAVLPAIPLFGLKKGLLGATHPLFAGKSRTKVPLAVLAFGVFCVCLGLLLLKTEKNCPILTMTHHPG